CSARSRGVAGRNVAAPASTYLLRAAWRRRRIFDPDWRDRRRSPTRGPRGCSRRRVNAGPGLRFMEALWTSAGLVAIAEIGDKTQLLAIVLAARFRAPVPIILGILCATLLNHAAAAALGFIIAGWLSGQAFQLVIGAAFIAMAAWALLPDKEDERAAQTNAGGV